MSRQEAKELDLPPQKSEKASKKKARKSSAKAGDKKGKAAGLQAPRMYSKVGGDFLAYAVVHRLY